jgi:hypothetical protein
MDSSKMGVDCDDMAIIQILWPEEPRLLPSSCNSDACNAIYARSPLLYATIYNCMQL